MSLYSFLIRLIFAFIIFGSSQVLGATVTGWKSAYALQKGLTGYCPERLLLDANQDRLSLASEDLKLNAQTDAQGEWKTSWTYKGCEIQSGAKLFNDELLAGSENAAQFPEVVFVSHDRFDCGNERRLQVNFYKPAADQDLQVVMTGIASTAISCWYAKAP